jgi:hypothetical protein
VTIRVFDVTEQRLPGKPQSGPGYALFYLHLDYDPSTGTVTETNYESFGSLDTFTFDRSLRSGARASGSMQLYGWRCIYTDGHGGGGPNGLLPRFPIALDHEEPDCAELGYATVDVALEWVGQGPVHRDVSRIMDGDPSRFRFHARTVVAARDASLSGHISSSDLHLADGPATFGFLLRGAYLERLLVNG